MLSGHQAQLQEGSDDPFEPLDNSLGRLTSVDSCSCQSGLYMGLTCRHQFSVANELGYSPQAVANIVLDCGFITKLLAKDDAFAASGQRRPAAASSQHQQTSKLGLIITR